MEVSPVFRARSYNFMIQPCTPFIVKAIFIKAQEEAVTGPLVLFEFYIMGQHF